MKPSLDIIIVNWNTGDALLECVRSIAAADQRRFRLARVVIVDNASSDQSLAGIAEVPLPVTIIRNAANRGFAAACNQGAAETGADYLLFLNPDTRLSQASLGEPVEFLERSENAGIGVCGIRLTDERGRAANSCYRFPTATNLWSEITGLSAIFPRQFPPRLMAPAELASSRAVDQVLGAFFLVRRPLFQELAGFDERFFIYFEEVDFSLRAAGRGHASYYLAGATAVHRGCLSSDRARPQRLVYSLTSRLEFSAKHFRPFSRFSLVLLTLVVEPAVRMLWSCTKRSQMRFRETVAGYGMFYRSLLQAWTRKRGRQTAGPIAGRELTAG